MINKQITLNAYVASALRATGQPVAIEPQSLERMRGEVDDFLASNAVRLLGSGLSSEQIGRDFWATRNDSRHSGHATGFKGLGRLGDELAEAARACGARGLEPLACGQWRYA